MSGHERIEVSPEIMFGKPVVKGTRVPVDRILRKMAEGLSIEEVITDHPRLTREDILAVLAYAADVVAQEEILLSGEGAPST